MRERRCAVADRGRAARGRTGRGPLRWLPFYWLTVVAIRAAGTAVGDFISGRNMLGLPMSTAVTGILLAVLLAVWREPATPKQAKAVPVN